MSEVITAPAPVAAPAAVPAATQPPVTDFRTFIDEKGTITQPDKVFTGDYAHLAKRFTSVDSLAKSYVNAERMLSNSNKVAVPGDNSTPEEWDAFYKASGRPESEDKYEVNIPEELKGMTLDDDAMKEFRSTAFKNGLNGKQVKALTDFYFKSTGAAITAVQAKMEAKQGEAVATLEKDWGPKDGAKFKENVALAQKGARAAGMPEEAFADPVVGNNPHFLRAMARVAGMIGESGAANVRGQSQNMGPDVDAQISAIRNDPKHPFHLKGHPDHAKAVQQMEGLFQKKFPQAAGT
jgi:hypothetical protein